MARYYFDVQNGKPLVRDDEGAEFDGSVAISGCGQKDLSAVRIRLCREPLELLNE